MVPALFGTTGSPINNQVIDSAWLDQAAPPAAHLGQLLAGWDARFKLVTVG